MVRVRLVDSHPGEWVKVFAEDGSSFRVTKRFQEFDDEYADAFDGDSLIVEGRAKKKPKKKKKSSGKKTKKTKKVVEEE